MAKLNPLSKAMKLFEIDTNLFDCFKFNKFSEQIEYNKAPCWNEDIKPGESINDDDIVHMKYYLTKVHGFEPHKSTIGEACYLRSHLRAYHPVKQYIEKEAWDGVPRLDKWILEACGCTDNTYTRNVSSKILIATVNRVYNPGCKFDHMMIMEGLQGIGKSTMLEELAGDFYLDTSFEHKDKDLVESMCRSLIVEISDLSGMSKKDVDWMKSFITRKVDRVRLPYAARAKDFKRKCVFIGTYNPSGNNTYLRDDTGNRRFWPIECNFINVKYVKENKHQLWAEAFSRFKDNERYYIEDAASLAILGTLHKDREFDGPIYYKIEDWLQKYSRDYVDMEEIIVQALNIREESKSNKEISSLWSVIGINMRKLRWRKGSNTNRRRYYPPDGFYEGVASKEKQEELPVDWGE